MKLKEFFKGKIYWLAALSLPLYLLYFFAAEHVVTDQYYVCHIWLDDVIPFCEYFVIPYVLWYPFLLIPGLYLMFKGSREEFLRFCLMVMGGMILSVTICLIFPNGQNLRPAIFPRDNVFTRLIGRIYQSDTNTNVLPSMHVLASLGACSAILHTKTKMGKPWIKAGALVMTILISLATVFIKQHSVLDGIAAIAIFIPMELIIYRFDLFFRKRAGKKDGHEVSDSQYNDRDTETSPPSVPGE